MAILPIGNLTASVPSPVVGTGSGTSGGGFASALSQALDSVSSSVAQSQVQGISLAEGTAPSLSGVMVAATQAQLAVDLTVQVRNRVIDAYNQVMNMQV